jgi:hypothetical protein
VSITSSISGPVGFVDALDYRPTVNHPDYRELIQAIQAINKAKNGSPFGSDSHVRFRVDSGTRRPVIEVVDKGSRILFQIPPENVIRLAEEAKTAEDRPLADHFAPSVSVPFEPPPQD